MPETMSVELVLVFIIASGWATLTGALSLVRYVDERRDLILLGRDEHGDLSSSHRRLLYESDWVPFKIVLVGFVFVTSLAYLVLGALLVRDCEGLLGLVGGVVAIFGTVGALGGGLMGVASLRERRLILEALRPRDAAPGG